MTFRDVNYVYLVDECITNKVLPSWKDGSKDFRAVVRGKKIEALWFEQKLCVKLFTASAQEYT